MKIRGLVKRFQQIVVDLAGNKDNSKADYVSRPAKSLANYLQEYEYFSLSLLFLASVPVHKWAAQKNGTDFHALAGVVSDFRMISVLVQTKFGILHTGNRMLLDSNLMDGFAQPTQKTFINSDRSSLCYNEPELECRQHQKPLF